MTAEQLRKLEGLTEEQGVRLEKYLQVSKANFSKEDFPTLKTKKDVKDLVDRLISQDAKNAEKRRVKEAYQKEKDSFVEYVESLKSYGITFDDCREILKNHLKELQKEKIQEEINKLREQLAELD